MKKIKFYITNFLLFMYGSACENAEKAQEALWKNDHYAIYKDKVVQQQYTAKVKSAYEISSDYQSPANLFKSPRLHFKFSINGKDNEMLSGMDHQLNITALEGTLVETPLITFGQQFIDEADIVPDSYLNPEVKLKIKLDLRHVIEAFEKDGFFTAFDGSKIYKEDFKSVHVAGNSDPLMWDFDNLVNRPELELKDEDKDGIFETLITLNAQENRKTTAASWKLSKDISEFPSFNSEYPLLETLYNLSLEEMEQNIEADGTFRTGAEWEGVWTRDISYSVMLSLSILHPEISQRSLLRKVKNRRIVQDTGTGGAYPVSTDRVVWAVAAWDIYKVTGNKEWLQEAYQIIENTLEDDLRNVYNPQTGLFKGESSFLDWREQTYPKWMQPADIYNSESLGTNAAFYQAFFVASEMARNLGKAKEHKKYLEMSQSIKAGINQHLWMDHKGYYGQFLYGRNFKLLSPRSEALGEALCVLFDIAGPEKQTSVVAHTPVNDYGIPCIYPQIPNIPPYHNNGIWPFVQSFWSLSAAKAGNENALMESLAAIFRPASLFLTNKENMVAGTGDFLGTQVNSDRQLWSVAGTLAMIYKVFFGIDYSADYMSFKPFVPETFQGTHRLSGFKYRNAILDIEVNGYGNKIKTITLNGQEIQGNKIPSDLIGQHQITVELDNENKKEGSVNRLKGHFSPSVPVVSYHKGLLSWKATDAKGYRVLRNGEELHVTTVNEIQVAVDLPYSEYQVIAIDGEGYESFASEPLIVVSEGSQSIFEAEEFALKSGLPYKGFSGKGFVEISRQKNNTIAFNISVPEKGLYAFDFRYANGNGPVNTENKCAARSLKIGNEWLGTIIFPQRGTKEWSNWGYTNSYAVELEKGKHIVTLSYEPHNDNMNGEINDALLDCLRVIKLN